MFIQRALLMGNKRLLIIAALLLLYIEKLLRKPTVEILIREKPLQKVRTARISSFNSFRGVEKGGGERENSSKIRLFFLVKGIRYVFVIVKHF